MQRTNDLSTTQRGHTMKSPKTSNRSRLARQSDRDYAAELARLFLSKEPLPLDINEEGQEVYRPLASRVCP
jgi:hypothetical protein